MKHTQNKKILGHLRGIGSITPLEALHTYGCLRLAARISDLRNAGHKISMKMITRNGKTFGQYSLNGG